MADTITRTNVNLISGVPFTSDYRHTRWFTSLAQQTNWFNQRPKVKSYNTANFQRVEGRFYFDCDVNVETLDDVKYIYFNNAVGAQKRYYGFVTRKEYINRHVTRVHFSLDVVQSFMFDMDFKPSYVMREHFQRYNGGRPIAQTLPEGLDYGKEYQVKDASHVINPYDVRFLVIVAKDRLHGSVEDDADIFPSYIVNPQPLYYYIIPFTPDGRPTSVKLKENSFHISTPSEIMLKLETLESLSNHVVSYYVTEDIGLPITSVDIVYDNNFHNHRTNFNEYNDFWDMEVVELDGDPGGKLVYVREIKQFFPTEFTVSENYWQRLIGTGNDMPSESKIMMSPYHIIELHDYRGNVIPIKPEYIQYDNKLIIVRKGSLGLSNKVSYNVKGYNMVDGVTFYAKNIENQHALIDNNPHDISVKNEMLAAFLQGNRNQLANQREGAEFNALMGYGQGVINTASSMARGDAFGTASGITSGVSSLGNGIIQIQGINALQSDIRNQPSNVSKMGNNTAFDVGNGFTGIFVVFKGLKYEYQRVLENFFKAYGYKSNLVKIPNFHNRAHFNYVQTIQCVIQGNFSNDYLVQLQQVFDNGITLWHTDDIGNYSLSNYDLQGGAG